MPKGRGKWLCNKLIIHRDWFQKLLMPWCGWIKYIPNMSTYSQLLLQESAIKCVELVGTWAKNQWQWSALNFLILLISYYNTVTPFSNWIESIFQEKKVHIFTLFTFFVSLDYRRSQIDNKSKLSQGQLNFINHNFDKQKLRWISRSKNCNLYKKFSASCISH